MVCHHNDTSVLFCCIQVFTTLRQNKKFPPEFAKRLHKEIPDIITRMMADDPSKRPSANEILSGKEFKGLKQKMNRKKGVKHFQPFIPLL